MLNQVCLVLAALWISAIAVPTGNHTCTGVVKHPVTVEVNVTEPVTFRVYTWCFRVPPRCSKYTVQMKDRVKVHTEMHNRTITVCCKGFVEMEGICVPGCPPQTECPNMHCNRTNHCYCTPGYAGPFCMEPCPYGFWGKDCKRPCDCPDGFTCHHLTGDCMIDDRPQRRQKKNTTIEPTTSPGAVKEQHPAVPTLPHSPSPLTSPSASSHSTTVPPTTTLANIKRLIPTIPLAPTSTPLASTVTVTSTTTPTSTFHTTKGVPSATRQPTTIPSILSRSESTTQIPTTLSSTVLPQTTALHHSSTPFSVNPPPLTHSVLTVNPLDSLLTNSVTPSTRLPKVISYTPPFFPPTMAPPVPPTNSSQTDPYPSRSNNASSMMTSSTTTSPSSSPSPTTTSFPTSSPTTSSPSTMHSTTTSPLTTRPATPLYTTSHPPTSTLTTPFLTTSPSTLTLLVTPSTTAPLNTMSTTTLPTTTPPTTTFPPTTTLSATTPPPITTTSRPTSKISSMTTLSHSTSSPTTEISSTTLRTVISTSTFPQVRVEEDDTMRYKSILNRKGVADHRGTMSTQTAVAPTVTPLTTMEFSLLGHKFHHVEGLPPFLLLTPVPRSVQPSIEDPTTPSPTLSLLNNHQDMPGAVIDDKEVVGWSQPVGHSFQEEIPQLPPFEKSAKPTPPVWLTIPSVQYNRGSSDHNPFLRHEISTNSKERNRGGSIVEENSATYKTPLASQSESGFSAIRHLNAPTKTEEHLQRNFETITFPPIPDLMNITQLLHGIKNFPLQEILKETEDKIKLTDKVSSPHHVRPQESLGRMEDSELLPAKGKDNFESSKTAYNLLMTNDVTETPKGALSYRGVGEDKVAGGLEAAGVQARLSDETLFNYLFVLLVGAGVVVIASIVVSSLILVMKRRNSKKKPSINGCIMAYGKPSDNTLSPLLIYNNSQYSTIFPTTDPLTQTTFFCPTFTNNYAERINRELCELSYDCPRSGVPEPLYVEIPY